MYRSILALIYLRSIPVFGLFTVIHAMCLFSHQSTITMEKHRAVATLFDVLVVSLVSFTCSCFSGLKHKVCTPSYFENSLLHVHSMSWSWCENNLRVGQFGCIVGHQCSPSHDATPNPPRKMIGKKTMRNKFGKSKPVIEWFQRCKNNWSVSRRCEFWWAATLGSTRRKCSSCDQWHESCCALQFFLSKNNGFIPPGTEKMQHANADQTLSFQQSGFRQTLFSTQPIEHVLQSSWQAKYCLLQIDWCKNIGNCKLQNWDSLRTWLCWQSSAEKLSTEFLEHHFCMKNSFLKQIMSTLNVTWTEELPVHTDWNESAVLVNDPALRFGTAHQGRFTGLVFVRHDVVYRSNVMIDICNSSLWGRCVR